ncbi:LacI family transcriptional regulator [Herbiconiux sp. CPCC 205716]|uniref:LacI family transcriptional regulator n=1 Tax=Herbiconiux gentiana TaxID=2970912 RepID=A0ABT2GEC1_9MICO|nr:LacI family DNA-binding transcriptional regulator [Herbiconiux gentiana]MCS5713640.1 LacI family transcriptional regulator [Herbiconiux gentiana]
MPKPPTMKDVAAAAGVALKTVSRHVNGATNIDPALASRIATAITELGYRHNLAAASIRPGRSAKVIGLVISDLANPYWSVLARSVERTLSENGYLLMTVSSEEDADRHRLLVDRLIAQRVDGLIVSPPRRDTTGWAADAAPLLPVVAIDRPLAPLLPSPTDAHPAAAPTPTPPAAEASAPLLTSPGADADAPHPTQPGAAADAPLVDTILADNAGGAEAATRELLRHGARRILFLGDSLELYTMRERNAGFRRALGLDPASDDDRASVATAHTAAEAAEVVTALLGTGRIDAVFAANNRASTGAVDAFTRAGTRLPLIGFDDFEAATLVRPGISVVAQDVAQMGETAAHAVLARLAGETPPPTTTTLRTRLVLRGSELP